MTMTANLKAVLGLRWRAGGWAGAWVWVMLFLAPRTSAQVSPIPIYLNVGGAALVDIPSNAASFKAYIQGTQVAGGSPQYLEVYGFTGLADLTSSLNVSPREFVGGALLGDSDWQVDVSRITQRFAGRRLGFLFQAWPQTNLNSSLPLTIQLFFSAPQSRDEAPYVRMETSTNQSGFLMAGDSVSLRAEVSDRDSGMTGWEVLDYSNVVFRATAALPAGTNQISATISNLALGSHQFSLRAFSSNAVGYSQLSRRYVAKPEELPAHHWLGSFGISQAFYVVDAAGRAHVWGENSSGQLGLGFVSEPLTHPVTLAGPGGAKFLQLVSGARHAAAIMHDGSLFAWGANDAGQIGQPFTTRTYPQPLQPPPPGNTLYFKRVAAMDTKTFMVDEKGAFWKLIPRFDPLNGGPVMDLRSAAGSYTEAMMTNGVLMDTVNSGIFIDRVGSFPSGVTAWIDYSLDATHGLRVGNNGQIYGLDTTHGYIASLTLQPPVPGVAGWKKVAAGERVNLAEDTQGRLWWWGIGFDEGATDPNKPKLVSFPKGTTNWLDITVTSTFAMALSEQGELFAWGLATPGTWNDPTASYAATPELVRGLPNLLDPNATGIETVLLAPRLGIGGDAAMARVMAPDGARVGIEASNDLVKWEPFTDLVATNGVAAFGLVMEGATRFYRVISQ